jgi:hypothetical protein
MGSSRSGSTLLDTVLSDQPGIFGAGELCNLITAMDVRHNYCACGNRSAECPLWTGVREEWSRVTKPDVAAEYPELRRRIERIRNYPRFHDGTTDDPLMQEYLELTRALFGAIAKVSSATTIVDSSKGPIRALALSRMKDVELRAIHLVRDVRGVAHSLAQSFASDPRGGVMTPLESKGPLRTARKWMLTNAIADMVRSRLGDRAILIRYEDYVTNPRATLQRLSAFAGLDFGPTAEKLEHGGAFKCGHTIEGNRLRTYERIELRPDVRWRKQMSKARKSLLPLLTAPVSWKYGYRPWSGE